ncbi:MAG: hypothetical protein IT385_16270 [Deltaproteobacteria bacterium]|nr:hypothetical protein [Deltaproteobacteria bacterium]
MIDPFLGPVLGNAPAPTTEHTLVFLGGGPIWVELGVWLLGAIIVALTVVNHRRLEPPARRRMMIALRAALVAVVMTLFYQPACLEERVATNRNTVAVLVDTSESMALPHGEGTRAGLARAWLDDHRDALDELAAEHELHFFSFGQAVTELPDADAPELADALVPRGSETRFVDALKDVRSRFRNHDIGGVVLLTDGIDTTSEGRRTGLSPELAAVLRELDAPVSSLTTAGDSGIKDLAVSHVGYQPFVFLLNAASFDATIEAHGYGSNAGDGTGRFPVRLLENGLPIAVQMLETKPGETSYRLRFEFVPKVLGKHVYTVAVDPQPDEILAKNNQKSVVVNVVRDKIRVVQIVGQPSWDERHLRNLLKENANVDLVSFFILVELGQPQLSSRETSLIPFPAQELFEEQLGGFDLLIFQNFNYGPFQTREYLPHIAQFVRNGGAFAMVGGPLSLSAGGYYGTEITDVLPIEIPPGWGADATTDPGEYTARLTESGGFHPIARLSLDPAQNKAIWGDLQPLEGINLASRVRDDAVVLVEHPTLTMPDGKPQPLVAVREVEKGRSLVVATDSTWHWAFKAGGEGKDPRHYETFWDNAIRWLIKDPELDLLKVRAVAGNVPVGETARVIVTALRPDYRPAAAQVIQLVVRRRLADHGRGEGEEVLRKTDILTDAQGEATIDLPIEAAGIYEVEAQANIVAGRTTTAIDLFVGTDSKPELERVVGDARFVTNLAEATQGKVLPLSASPSDLPLEAATVMRVKSRTHKDLWSAPWALALVVGLFGLEWWLRRRYGYL